MARKKKISNEINDPIVQEFIKDHPERVIEMRGRPLTVEELFAGEEFAGIRNDIIHNGKITRGSSVVHMPTRVVDGRHEIMAVAAVSRDPGLTQEYIDSIQDYLDTSARPQDTKVKQLWQIYYKEGVVNTAVNKIAAILSGGGQFKVRKAKLGRKTTAQETLDAMLYEWTINLNDSPEDGVITGSRGVQAVTHQAVRQALVEGDWFGRQNWVKHEVPGYGVFSMPMNIQTISSAYMEPEKGLSASGSGVELFYWKPPSDFVQQLRNPSSKEMKDIIKRFLPKDTLAALIKNGKVLMDPALMLHIKHRGQDNNVYGESFITPAMNALAFKRSLDNLEFVTITNLINRLSIVMVGSDDPTSPFFKQDVAQYRAALMQQFFEDPGPNMTIVWAGHDVEVVDIGAHSKVLDLDNRHGIAMDKVKLALGVPDAILSGSTTDGKAAGWAATLGAASQLEELQNAFAKAWTRLGKRMATENGFTDVDLVFEFDKALLVDRIEEMNQTRLDYTAGILSIRDVIEARGKDSEAVFLRKCFEKGLDPNTATWEEAFMPPQGLAGQSDALTGAPGQGRVEDDVLGKPKSKAPAEKKTTQENK